MEDRQQHFGQAISLISQLDDARLAGANRGEFAGDVQGVEKDQHCYDEENGQEGEYH
jgi:hypothetical protein